LTVAVRGFDKGLPQRSQFRFTARELRQIVSSRHLVETV